jgi:hypothetical protein
MPRRPSALAAYGVGLVAFAVALLPACAPLEPPPPAFASPHPIVSPVQFSHGGFHATNAGVRLPPLQW